MVNSRGLRSTGVHSAVKNTQRIEADKTQMTIPNERRVSSASNQLLNRFSFSQVSAPGGSGGRIASLVVDKVYLSTS